MDALGVQLGFGFSAGLFDYVLNFGKATRPLLLLPVGLAYFARLLRRCSASSSARFDLQDAGPRAATRSPPAAPTPASERGAAFVAALGGAANLATVDACTTRLRLIVRRPERGRRSRAEGARRARRGPAVGQGAAGRARPDRRPVAGEIRDALALGWLMWRPQPAAPVQCRTTITPVVRTESALGGAANVRRAAAIPVACASSWAIARWWTMRRWRRSVSAQSPAPRQACFTCSRPTRS